MKIVVYRVETLVYGLGVTIQEAAVHACMHVTMSVEPMIVRFDFNGTPLEVVPGMNSAMVCKDYYSKRTEEHS